LFQQHQKQQEHQQNKSDLAQPKTNLKLTKKKEQFGSEIDKQREKKKKTNNNNNNKFKPRI
jgi:hypothetical protein